MKTFFKVRYAIGAIVTVLLVACATDPLSNMQATMPENPDYETIRALGFSTEGIVETYDCYIVEGDIILDKEAMPDYASKTRQAKYSVTVSLNRVQNIKVYIHTDIDTSWRQAATEALNEWNNIENCTIGFSLVASSGSADVVFQSNSGIVGSTVAQAYYPQGGHPGTPV
jgi:hypothetical protein